MIHAGKLHHKITIQSKIITQDSELNAIETWTDWKTVWAEAVSQTSREYYRLSTQNPEVTKVFRIRYLADVTAQKRIEFGGQYFEILGPPINEDERNVSLLIVCKGAV